MAASKPVEAAMVSASGPGSGSGVGGSSATSGPGSGGLPRWQLALAVGAPLLLGAGALYLWSRQRRRRDTGARGDSGGLKRNSERKTPEGRASPAPGSGHPDGPGTHLEMRNMTKPDCVITDSLTLSQASECLINCFVWFCWNY